MQVDKEKQSLRLEMRSRRDELTPERIAADSQLIAERLAQLPCVEKAGVAMIYVSFRSEVVTHDLIRARLEQARKVAVPRIDASGEMHAALIESWGDLQPGRYGLLQPSGAARRVEQIDVCITPGLAFTRSGDRLGYGQGNYDRFFAAHPPTIAVALAFEMQIVDRLPVDAHDRPMDWIVTPEASIHVAGA